MRTFGLYFLGFIGAMASCAGIAAAAESGQQPPASPTVRVVVDYSDGAEKHINAIAWKAEMTVLDAMEAAGKHPHGITLKFRGKGATALLTRIDDVENEGAGRNWVYRVNGKVADRGMGVFELHSGDTILWKFEKYR
jgi:hypothetical protein